MLRCCDCACSPACQPTSPCWPPTTPSPKQRQQQSPSIRCILFSRSAPHSRCLVGSCASSTQDWGGKDSRDNDHRRGASPIHPALNISLWQKPPLATTPCTISSTARCDLQPFHRDKRQTTLSCGECRCKCSAVCTVLLVRHMTRCAGALNAVAGIAGSETTDGITDAY